MNNFLKNYFSTASLIVIAYIYMKNNYFYTDLMNFHATFIFFDTNVKIFIHYFFYFYLLILIPYYLIEPEPSKARDIYSVIYKKFKNIKYKISPQEKTSILTWCVKLFFVPFMLTWFIQDASIAFSHIYNMTTNFDSFSENFRYFFDNYLFYSIFRTMMLIDISIFSFWYIVESKYLKNVIKSVEPTLFWWVIALICYPPFNSWTWDLTWWYSQNFPIFSNSYIHIIFNILLLISFGFYVWASVALWSKASNLTNRWIVSRWPYKYIRHPAYLWKNLTRTIWALPIIITAISSFDIMKLLLIIFSMIIWFIIYYFRAMTEENHLSQDKDYIEYKKKVKYKFIPWVF